VSSTTRSWGVNRFGVHLAENIKGREVRGEMSKTVLLLVDVGRRRPSAGKAGKGTMEKKNEKP